MALALTGLMLAGALFLSAVAVYLYARLKSAAAARCDDTRRRRALLNDFGDCAVWQMGQRATTGSAVATPESSVTTRRGFLPRIAVSLLILIAGRRTEPAVAAQGSRRALAWERGHPERRAWSDELRSAIGTHLATLETASDIESFAPGYSRLSTEDRVHAWATLFVAMARFESGYKPNAIYRESFQIDSVGLLQISYENEQYYGLERLDRKARSLEDPLVNLRCGVRILSVLVSRDGVIASGTGRASRGGARYWSTLRTDGRVSAIQRMVRDAVAPPRHLDTPHGDSR